MLDVSLMNHAVAQRNRRYQPTSFAIFCIKSIPPVIPLSPIKICAINEVVLYLTIILQPTTGTRQLREK
jgi:hypothetical protein